MNTRIASRSVLLLIAVLAACDDFLSVENQNAPDRERAVAQPEDVENLIGSSFFAWWKGTQNQATDVTLSVAADEFEDPYDNIGHGLRQNPRQAWSNDPAARAANVTVTPWYGMYQALTSASEGVAAIEGGVEIGDDGEGTPRALAFGKFVQGLSQGFLALLFDQAFIVDETTAESDLETLELQPYPVVMEAAIAHLDEAAQIADANSFSLPEGWISGNPMTSAEFARLIRSYTARYLALVARTPEERAAVDWHRVIQLVDGGLQSGFFILANGAGSDLWGDFDLKFIANQDFGGRADYFTVGPADTSGNFEAWRSALPHERRSFLIHTSDRRIAGVDSLTAPGKYFTHHAVALAQAQYRQHKYDDYKEAAMQGPNEVMVLAELDMLKAEALLHTGGSLDEVAGLINKTRVGVGELPPATASVAPGTWSDPQDPLSNGPDDEVTLWSMLKHEKRMETYATSTGITYFDDRGWGELVERTPLHFPVPGQELITLGLEIYTFGGGGEWSSSSGIQ